MSSHLNGNFNGERFPNKTQYINNQGQVLTSSSAMAERPRELGDFKKARVNGGTNNHSLKDSHKCFRCRCRPASYGNQIISSTRPIAATYICRRSRGGCDQYCRRPSDVYDTDRRTKLTALETISRWLTQKAKKSLFEPFFRTLRGNVRTPSMARWKARGRLYIRRNWTFSLSPTVETLLAEIGRSWRFSKGGGSLWAQISEGRGRRPPTAVGVRVAEWLPFRVVSKHLQCTI